jgi:hypothetical protein
MGGGLVRGAIGGASTPEAGARAAATPGRALSMLEPIDNPNEASMAQSAGRAVGAMPWAIGGGFLRTLIGNAGSEAADYAIQKSGGGALARFAGALVGGVGAEQLTSATNRKAVAGAATAATNSRTLKAYRGIKALDLIDEGMGKALDISKSRAARMMTATTASWNLFDASLRAGLPRGGRALRDTITIDPTDLYREAAYQVSKTPQEFRSELPKVILALAERDKKGGEFGRMSLSDLRGFHEQVNDLWRRASHRNSDVIADQQAAIADNLRGPIERAYAGLLSQTPGMRGTPTVQRGGTLPNGRGAFAPVSGSGPPLRTGKIPAETITVLGTDQANALRRALESNIQLGSELNNLRKAGIDLASGADLDPAKVTKTLLAGKRVDAPELAKDFMDVLTREDPSGGRLLSQAWKDHVIGPTEKFSSSGMLKRLDESRAVGNIWAGEEKVKALEAVVRSLSNKEAPDHSFAKSVLSPALGIAASGATAFGAGGVPTSFAHAFAAAGSFAVAASVPLIFIRIKDRYGPEALALMQRELLMDRGKYRRMAQIAAGTPKAGDFEWVDTQVRGLMIRQANEANRLRQVNGEPQ